MAIRLGNNIAALLAAGRLDRSSRQLALSLERLSSGMRINHASDDAAGLAMSASLNSDARVFGQGMRNINDGQSALNIAQSGVEELSNILARLRELAASSANGTFSRTQRLTMDNEAHALTQEYNRLIATTTFNGISLLNGTSGRLNIQLGYGSNGSIDVGTGNDLARRIGTGSFSAVSTLAVQSNATTSVIGDFNGDGNMDTATVGHSQTLVTRLGNGDGTFKAGVTATIGSNGLAVEVGDFDRDGNLDLAVSTNDGLRIMRNGGGSNPTFTLSNTIALGSFHTSLAVGDINGDGKADVVTGSTDSGTSSANILIGNGNGTFQAAVSISGISVRDVKLADMNGDGKLDLVAHTGLTSFPSDSRINIFIGNGNGTFQERRSYFFANSAGTNRSFDIADINHDGLMDVVAGTGFLNGYAVLLGNTDGSLQTATTVTLGIDIEYVQLEDINGDGLTDLLLGSVAGAVVRTLIGNGDGTFSAHGTYAYSNMNDLSTGDFNNDGALDILSTSNGGGSIGIFMGQSQTTNNSQRLNLTTREAALQSLDLIEAAANRISAELGRIGSHQSRLQTAFSALSATRDNYYAAYGRIVDADVAFESANLIRNKILQQSGAAVLAQAALQPALVLQLLKIN